MNTQVITAMVVVGGIAIWHHHVFRDTDPDTVSNTTILVGAFLALGLFALLDTIPGASPVLGGLAMFAMITVIIKYLPALLPSLAVGGAPVTSQGAGPTQSRNQH